MTARTEASSRHHPAGRQGGCSFRGVFGDGPCGEPADHWCEAIRRPLCAEHHRIVTQQFIAVALDIAEADCDVCG